MLEILSANLQLLNDEGGRMKIFKNNLSTCFLILIILAGSISAQNKTGTTIGQFLKI
jgi:hypothetical protein